jgi:uncharacterized membrane protein YtjA (UPF0391 family)
MAVPGCLARPLLYLQREQVNDESDDERRVGIMLYYSLVFLVIALVAGLLGFGGIAGTASSIAQVLFALFLIFFLVSLIMSLVGRGRPPL